jgi:hypothetical protein
MRILEWQAPGGQEVFSVLNDPASGHVAFARGHVRRSHKLAEAMKLMQDVSASASVELILHDARTSEAFSIPPVLFEKHVQLNLADIDLIGMTPAAVALVAKPLQLDAVLADVDVIQHEPNELLTQMIERLLATWAGTSKAPRSVIVSAQARATDPKTALRERLRETIPMIDASVWAQRRGLSGKNVSAALGKYKGEGRVFAVPEGRRDLYPEFQFDESDLPWPAMQQILAAVPADARGWPLLSWFDAPNERLGGRRPREALAKEPAAVLAAVQRFYSADE